MTHCPYLKAQAGKNLCTSPLAPVAVELEWTDVTLVCDSEETYPTNVCGRYVAVKSEAPSKIAEIPIPQVEEEIEGQMPTEPLVPSLTPNEVEPKVEEDMEVEAHDEQALLYSWLEKLLVKFDLTDNLYSRFKILSMEETSSGLKLKAKIWGEPLNLAKHPRKVGVKAVTYHRMEILKKPREVTVKFILDI